MLCPSRYNRELEYGVNVKGRVQKSACRGIEENIIVAFQISWTNYEFDSGNVKKKNLSLISNN
jgi:hypothetical protein